MVPWMIAATALLFLGILWLRARQGGTRECLALMCAGAAGNLADRLLYGYVVDWIYAGLYVNLADLWLIFGGIGFCLLRSGILRRKS